MRVNEPVLGIDLGSRTTKIVKFAGGEVKSFEIFDTDHNPVKKVQDSVKGLRSSTVIATGYGRHLLKTHFANKVVTEITACARGANFLYPNCGTVIDIGGQDCKVIQVTADGGFDSFEMNDRCAAGTGRFLEVMARILGYEIEEFWKEALSAKHPITINSMCTVFAESEVISLITSGKDRRNIALGLHHSIVDRLYTLIAKVEIREEIMLVGGVAKNRCIEELLKKKLQSNITVPENPQIVSATGAALIGR